MKERNFPSPAAAVQTLRREGWKPLAGKPRVWKRVHDQQVQQARLRPLPSGRVRVEADGSG